MHSVGVWEPMPQPEGSTRLTLDNTQPQHFPMMPRNRLYNSILPAGPENQSRLRQRPETNAQERPPTPLLQPQAAKCTS